MEKSLSLIFNHLNEAQAQLKTLRQNVAKNDSNVQAIDKIGTSLVKINDVVQSIQGTDGLESKLSNINDKEFDAILNNIEQSQKKSDASNQDINVLPDNDKIRSIISQPVCVDLTSQITKQHKKTIKKNANKRLVIACDI